MTNLRLPKGARAVLRAIEGKGGRTGRLTPREYVREIKRISNNRYYSKQVRKQASTILDRILNRGGEQIYL